MSQPEKVNALLRDMDSFFGAATEDEGKQGGHERDPRQEDSRAVSSPDSAKAPTDSLSRTVTPPSRSKAPTPPSQSFPLEIPVAHPIEGRPGFYEIEGEVYGPDSWFSRSKGRLKGRPYARALAYCLSEFHRTHGFLACVIAPDQEHYLSEDQAEIHHTKRHDWHQAKFLTIACHRHNSRHGDPEAKEQGRPTTSETERENPAQALARNRSIGTNERSLDRSDRMYPRAVEYVFHPEKGKLARVGQTMNKSWLVNNLPDIVGMGRATTYGKYVGEWVAQGYLKEGPSSEGSKLTRTGKKAADLLWRELGLRIEDVEAFPPLSEPYQGVHA